jgi:hypothetical protein
MHRIIVRLLTRHDRLRIDKLAIEEMRDGG